MPDLPLSKFQCSVVLVVLGVAVAIAPVLLAGHDGPFGPFHIALMLGGAVLHSLGLLLWFVGG